ncbi:hypothetical protein HII31_10930 [Pseudocercospora fuligena]|uniref:ZZ-type domain-containing protein n=1 Tax=Pseudocercospora fuligena TaxID=685502 RepID=A0A8H6R7Y2_9PEZI|nr:hypothetical protein HII31_10930 [Pseudocercospora fuligena]
MSGKRFQSWMERPMFYYSTLSSDGVFSDNDQDYAKLVHHRTMCDGKSCRRRKTYIAGPRYACSECEGFDLCPSCARDKDNGHNASHEFFRCVVPPKLADPIIAERKSRDSDPASTIQNGDRHVDSQTGERNEAGELLEDTISAHEAGTYLRTSHEVLWATFRQQRSIKKENTEEKH